MKISLLVLFVYAMSFGLSITDNFNRTDEAPVASPWAIIPELDSYWKATNLTGNKVVGGADNYCGIYYASKPTNDQWAQVSVLGAPVAYPAGPIVRAKLGGYATCYAAYRKGADTLVVCKLVNQLFTILGKVKVGTNWASGDSLRLEAVGTTIRAIHRGASVDTVSATDATLDTGYVGISLFLTSNSFDDFSGGDYVTCASPTITRHATINDTVGNSGRYGHAVSGTIDSTKRIGTWPDSTAMVAYTTKDTIAYRWKSKLALAGYALRSYGCTDSSTAYDSVSIIGPSVSYSAATDTLNVAMTADVASTAMADSFTIKTAPLWMDIDRSGGTKGRLSGTPDSVKSYTVSVYAWRKDVKADSGDFALTVVSGLRLDSIAPDTGVAGVTISVYGRNFGATKGSSTVAFGDSTPTPSSWSNTRIQFPCPAFPDTGTFDFIVDDGTVADTIVGGFFYSTAIVLGGIAPASGVATSEQSVKIWSSNSGIGGTSTPLCSLFNATHRYAIARVTSTADTFYGTRPVVEPGTYSVLLINGYGQRDTLVDSAVYCSPTVLTRAPSQTVTVYATITPLVHAWSGGTPDSLRLGVGVTLPAGLTMHPGTGTISGQVTDTTAGMIGIQIVAYGCSEADTVYDSIRVNQRALTIYPASSDTAGLDTVTIRGSGFGTEATVTVLGEAATVVSCVDTQIVAVVPAHAAGTGDVVVTNGAFVQTITDGFRYYLPVTGGRRGRFSLGLSLGF